jgi:hypothetical protein
VRPQADRRRLGGAFAVESFQDPGPDKRRFGEVLGGGNSLDFGLFFGAESDGVHLLVVRSAAGRAGWVGLVLGLFGFPAELLGTCRVNRLGQHRLLARTV